MTSAIWLKASHDGREEKEVQMDVSPGNGEAFTLEELQHFVEGNGSKTISTIVMPSGKVMVVNDNGLIVGLPYNHAASKIWKMEWPIEQYPHNNSGMIVGNVLICSKKQAGYEEE